MANEISLSAAIQIVKNGATAAASASKTEDMSANAFFANTQSVGTSNEAIAVNDVSSKSHLFIKNLDETNFVTLSIDSDGAQKCAKIKAGQFALIPTDPDATYYLKADTATCAVTIVLCSL